MKYIISLDQGTSSSRAIAFNKQGIIIYQSQKEFQQIYPQPGWVEHNPIEIWNSQLAVLLDTIDHIGGSINVECIGITNQRETIVCWDKTTGMPLSNAIVWQDRRTSIRCDELKKMNYSELIHKKTGLVIDAYFSATKIEWLLQHIPNALKKAAKNELAVGTIDSWLVYKLTNGRKHITDVSNASRTMLFNINTLKWDEELLKIFSIPNCILPTIHSSSDFFGESNIPEIQHSIPITGIAGDQQAALFGQQCTKQGMVKNTYGTGCFLMMNTEDTAVFSKNNLLTTIGWQLNNKISYAIEGSIFIGGALIQWLRDELGIISKSSEIEVLANSVPNNGGVVIIPAFSGLGAPYWDQYARGTILGLTRGSNRSHIARAALEAICLQSYDVLKAMEKDSGLIIKELRVDGGAVVNNLLMQIQSDILQCQVSRPVTKETTALGAAYLAGLATGYWKNLNDIEANRQIEKIFHPSENSMNIEKLITHWHKGIERAKNWEDH